MNKLRELFEKDTPIASYQFDPVHLTDEAKALIYGEPQGLYNISFSFEVQRRKHRKKRTNKKWLKRYGYKQLHISLDGKIEKAEGNEFVFTSL